MTKYKKNCDSSLKNFDYFFSLFPKETYQTSTQHTKRHTHSESENHIFLYCLTAIAARKKNNLCYIYHTILCVMYAVLTPNADNINNMW